MKASLNHPQRLICLPSRESKYLSRNAIATVRPLNERRDARILQHVRHLFPLTCQIDEDEGKVLALVLNCLVLQKLKIALKYGVAALRTIWISRVAAVLNQDCIVHAQHGNDFQTQIKSSDSLNILIMYPAVLSEVRSALVARWHSSSTVSHQTHRVQPKGKKLHDLNLSLQCDQWSTGAIRAVSGAVASVH